VTKSTFSRGAFVMVDAGAHDYGGFQMKKFNWKHLGENITAATKLVTAVTKFIHTLAELFT